MTIPQCKHGQYGGVCYRAQFEAELERLRAASAAARALVAEQAEDDGLWFNAATAPEAYLQQELRRLHAAIEGKSPELCALALLER